MSIANKAIIALNVFFILVLAVAFAGNPYYPIRVISGEQSVGTWMSGVLLIISATVATSVALQPGNRFWYTIAMFFSLLALDERFMFHEQLKQVIIFSAQDTPRWIYELPAIAGACVGAVVACALWHRLNPSGQKLLLIAVALGTISVTMDVLATTGILWEDSCKLLAELAITCALIKQMES